MSAPSDLYYKQGEACCGEQELFTMSKDLIIAEVC